MFYLFDVYVLRFSGPNVLYEIISFVGSFKMENSIKIVLVLNNYTQNSVKILVVQRSGRVKNQNSDRIIETVCLKIIIVW